MQWGQYNLSNHGFRGLLVILVDTYILICIHTSIYIYTHIELYVLRQDTQSREHARMQGLQVKSSLPAFKTQYSEHAHLKGMSKPASKPASQRACKPASMLARRACKSNASQRACSHAEHVIASQRACSHAEHVSQMHYIIHDIGCIHLVLVISGIPASMCIGISSALSNFNLLSRVII
jgi:hypothetical protein